MDRWIIPKDQSRREVTKVTQIESEAQECIGYGADDKICVNGLATFERNSLVFNLVTRRDPDELDYVSNSASVGDFNEKLTYMGIWKWDFNQLRTVF